MKSYENRDPLIAFGSPDEWKYFLNFNPTRMSAIESVRRLANNIFLRSLITDKPFEQVAFNLGRMCIEEFNEILLLGGNGYGIGALKILRGMYERAVTARPTSCRNRKLPRTFLTITAYTNTKRMAI
jgi:hypothetical protein